MAKTIDVAGRDELTGLHEIAERYRLDGPHATVVMLCSTPGQNGDDRKVRWHARRTELAHLGAGTAALEHLDHEVESLDPRGEMVLVTANDAGAAHCWLTDYDVVPMAHVGEIPALLAAVDELADRTPVVAALVDHAGADVYLIDHIEVADAGSVTADPVEDRGHTKTDHASHERRLDAAAERTAAAIARAIEHAATSDTRLIVLTGDDREVASVERHLDTHRFTVSVVQAGGRHEPGAVQRLRRAALDESLRQRQRRSAEAVAELRRALGQHALGTEGNESTATAADEGRVATLFLDRTRLVDGADTVARDTLARGGSIVIADELGVADGVAALLRYGID